MADVRLEAMRVAFRTVGTMAPGVAARWAEAMFCRPPRQEARQHEEAFLASGRQFAVRGAGNDLVGWEWGEGPAVVLVHGWGSRAGRFTPLATALLERGFRVIVYDGPAHGRSTGKQSSLAEFTDALFAVTERSGEIFGLIGHSLGAAAVTFGLGRGLGAQRVVLLAPPEEMDTYASIFVEKLAIPEPVHQLMRANIEARLRIRWADLHLPSIAARLRMPALIVHDVDDVDVPWAQGSAVAGAWPGAEFVSTTGLGHRGIVRDPAVVAQVAAFVHGGAAA